MKRNTFAYPPTFLYSASTDPDRLRTSVSAPNLLLRPEPIPFLRWKRKEEKKKNNYQSFDLFIFGRVWKRTLHSDAPYSERAVSTRKTQLLERESCMYVWIHVYVYIEKEKTFPTVSAEQIYCAFDDLHFFVSWTTLFDTDTVLTSFLLGVRDHLETF